MFKLLAVSQTAALESQQINRSLAKADNRKDTENETNKKRQLCYVIRSCRYLKV